MCLSHSYCLQKISIISTTDCITNTFVILIIINMTRQQSNSLQWLCLTLSVSHLLAVILASPLTALGGHELFQATLMCNNPFQFFHLSIVLGEILHCLLSHHGHLGLSLHPYAQKIII